MAKSTPTGSVKEINPKAIAPSLPQSSKFHMEVCNVLDKLDVHYINECMAGPYYVDIYIPNLKLRLEVNGPSHYKSSRRHSASGRSALEARDVQITRKTRMKERHLQRSNLVNDRVEYLDSVDLHEWKECKSLDERINYIRSKLSKYSKVSG